MSGAKASRRPHKCKTEYQDREWRQVLVCSQIRCSASYRRLGGTPAKRNPWNRVEPFSVPLSRKSLIPFACRCPLGDAKNFETP